jgi:hypothetical protein
VKRLRLAGSSLAILLLAGQAATAQAQRAGAQATRGPITALALDGSRVAYAGGGRIHVWNMATGATSIVKGTYSNAKRTVNAAQIAIAGKRVAWIKDQGFGNTEEDEKLYTASVGGTAHRVKHVYRYGRDDPSLTTGGWIAGLVGAGRHLVVSTWKSNGTNATDEQLSLVTANGLSSLAGGPGAIVSEAVDGGHIAVLASSPWSTATSASIYTVAGEPLAQIPLAAASEIALSANLLIVLTPAPTPSIQVYDWTTGILEHTWPAVGAATMTGGPHQVAHVKAYGGLVLYSVYTGYIGNNESLHVLDPATGRDAKVAKVQGVGALQPWAFGARGAVYALNTYRSGKLVFVPTAKLESLLDA